MANCLFYLCQDSVFTKHAVAIFTSFAVEQTERFFHDGAILVIPAGGAGLRTLNMIYVHCSKYFVGDGDLLILKTKARQKQTRQGK